MSSKEDIRERVSRDYADAVQGATSSCCGDKACATVASMAGYAPEDIAALPDDALVSSFGCGNPLAFSQVSEGETVLDLGSGAGVDLILAARRVGETGRVIGVDMTDEMIAQARKNIDAAGLPNIEIRKGIIEKLPVEDASVDWVISNCVINLSPEKELVFAEIARVLKPGGRVQVSDIVAESLPQALRDSGKAHSACIAGAISESEYCDGLRNAGLVDIEVPERMIYEESQLRAMAGELGLSDAGDADAILRETTGNVWSAQFRARKPAAASCCGPDCC